jgi:2-polyprenyl-3-methyl-5-hydroxy-6-metoxy-1,4-benzoquinol methylase
LLQSNRKRKTEKRGQTLCKPINVCFAQGGGGAKFEFVKKLRDDDSRSVYRCVNCGHVQVLPLPTVTEDEEYYQSDKMYKNLYKDDEAMQNEKNLMHRYHAYVEDQMRKFKMFLKKGERILDIGTGYGWLVEFLRNDGHVADGVEISDEKRELCKHRCGVEIYGWNFLEDVPEVRDKAEYYDVVCLQQTLEHISKPVEFVKRAAYLLKPGGRIYIAVPNENDALKIIEPEYINHHYMRSHLHYFTPDTLTALLHGCGFANVQLCGHQVYGIESHIWWSRNKKPYMQGHMIDLPEALEWINQQYKHKLESELKSNVIIGIGYKKQERETKLMESIID